MNEVANNQETAPKGLKTEADEGVTLNPKLTSITNTSDLNVKNIMVDVVWDKIDSVVSHIDGCCNCTKCRNDILAIVLNSIPSKYVATKQGELFSRINISDIQNDTNLSAVITSAALYVKEHPRHDA